MPCRLVRVREVIGQFRRAQKRHLRAILAGNISNFRVIRADQNVPETA